MPIAPSKRARWWRQPPPLPPLLPAAGGPVLWPLLGHPIQLDHMAADAPCIPSRLFCCSAAAATERAGLIAPHGGKLVNLMLPEGALPILLGGRADLQTRQGACGCAN